MAEKYARLWSHQNQIDEVIRIIYVTLHVDTTQLRDVELQIKSLVRVEVRIDPTSF
jgi:hypothetical protein